MSVFGQQGDCGIVFRGIFQTQNKPFGILIYYFGFYMIKDEKRRKIGSDYIETIRGFGYRFAKPVERCLE